jgi:hypothetical protein
VALAMRHAIADAARAEQAQAAHRDRRAGGAIAVNANPDCSRAATGVLGRQGLHAGHNKRWS